MTLHFTFWKWTFSMSLGATEEDAEDELDELLGEDLEILVVPTISLN